MLPSLTIIATAAAVATAQFANNTLDNAGSQGVLLTDENIASTMPAALPSSVLQLDPSAIDLSSNATVMSTSYEVVSEFTTFCPVSTTLRVNNKTIVVSEPTMITITDCPCTLTHIQGGEKGNSVPSGAPPQEPSPPAATTTTRTEVVSQFTTYCPESTTLTFNNKTIVVSEPSTVTITDCPCTLTHIEEHNPDSTAPAVTTSVNSKSKAITLIGSASKSKLTQSEIVTTGETGANNSSSTTKGSSIKTANGATRKTSSLFVAGAFILLAFI